MPKLGVENMLAYETLNRIGPALMDGMGGVNMANVYGELDEMEITDKEERADVRHKLMRYIADLKSKDK